MSGKEQLEAGSTVTAGSLEIAIDRVVGSRTQSTVYEGKSKERRVALKIADGPAGRDARFRDAWKAELERAAKIRSERALTVSAHGVGVATAGRTIDAPFVVTPWIDGEDAMAKVTRLGPMPAWSASSILEQIADVLASAHDAGVVHRDLSAESLWLTPAPPPATEPALRVAFTGVAKVASEVKKNTLAAMDRPLWMAPEQTETDVVLTPATDVFTFGLLTYWLLVGKVFWRSPESDVMSLMREMTYDAIPKASERAQQQGAGARCPHGFDAWFAKAVTKRPRDRFQGLREAFGALVPFIRQAIDVQRNEAILAAGRAKPAPKPAETPKPAPVEAPKPAPVEAPKAAPVEAPKPAAERPAIAKTVTDALVAPARDAIARTVAGEPISVREPAPEPIAAAPRPVAVDVSATLVSPVAEARPDVPAPKRVDEPVVVPMKANHDTLIGAPQIDAPPASAANTLIGYAQPATPVEGTLTEEARPPAPKEEPRPPAEAYAGALARFATPTPPTTQAAGSPPGAIPLLAPPPPPTPPSPMDQARIAPVRDTAEGRAERRRWIVMIAAILGVVVVFGAVGATITYALVDKDDRRRERDAEDDDAKKKKRKGPSADGTWSDATSPVPVTSDDPMWGDRDAAVTIVDFVDYESMSSRALEAALAQVRRRYKTSQVRIVWKNFPEPQHELGAKAAITGQAVFDVGGPVAFLRFHDDASANTGSLNELSIETWGITAGVKRDALRKAVEAPDNARKLGADLDLGQKLGLDAAGVLYINGERYELETSARLFKKIDDAMMDASEEKDRGTAPEDVYVSLSKKNFIRR